MIFSAILPVVVHGTRIGHQNPGVRRHAFWQEFDVMVPSVKSEYAPIVASWEASFDERLVFRTSRNDWGAYPDSGEQHVRHHNGKFWRQAMKSDLADSPLSSPILDAETFAKAFDRPENNLYLSDARLPSVGKGKPVVRDIGEYMELVQTYGSDHSANEVRDVKLRGLSEKFLVVEGIVYIECSEPMIELSDCAVLDRQSKASLLLRVITDPKECDWRVEKTPHRLFPLSEFDEAMASASEPDFDESACLDQVTNVNFNEIRRPHIIRHDHLTELDYRSFQALCRVRNFARRCELTDRIDHHRSGGPNADRTSLHWKLVSELKSYDEGDVDAFGRIEDLLPSIHAAWHGTFMDMTTAKIIALLDDRPIFLPHSLGGPQL
jgi:hypothetical protein